MRQLLSVSLLALGFSSAGCHTSWGHRVEGEGPYTATERSVGSFEEVSVAGGFELEVRVGGGPRVVIHADENLHEYIRTEMDGDELEIWVDGSISSRNPLRAEIDVPHPRALDIAGSADMTVSGLAGESFEIDVAGSAKGTFSGSVRRLSVDIAGSSDLDLFDLEADEVSIDIAGSGKVKTTARELLDVDVAGSGKVTYRGHPSVTIDQAGSASVKADS